MPQLLCCLLALVLFGGAIAVLPPSSRSGLDLGRDLVRPVALPVLWQGLRGAEQEGGAEEYVARGRLLMQFLPEWTDGFIHLAWQLAFDASLAKPSVEARLDRMDAALSLLEDALQGRPKRPEDILETMAYIVDIRCRQEPELAAAFEKRHQMEPAAYALRYFERAELHNTSRPRLEQKAMITTRLIAGRLRRNDVKGANVIIDRVVVQLQQFRDKGLAMRWTQALKKLKAYLSGDDRVTLQDLQKYPELEDILEAMKAVRIKPRKGKRR